MGKLLDTRTRPRGTPSADHVMRSQPWPHLALESTWWSRLRDRPPVRTALAHVLHEVWARRLQQAFRENEQLGRGVRNITQLAELIVRDPSGLNRRVNSETGDATLTDLFLFAWALRVPVSDLLPSQVDWIAGAVRYLCPQVGAAEAQAYALYRWHAPPTEPDALDDGSLARVLKQLNLASNAEAQAVVLRAADCLEQVLAPFAHRLREGGTT